MNISELLNHYENDNDRSTIIAQGFENSIYYYSSLSLDQLFKECVEMFLRMDPTLRLQQNNILTLNTLSGGLKIGSVKKAKEIEADNNDTTKKRRIRTKNPDGIKSITFGSDLKIILNNLIALIGYEFAYCILNIASFPNIIKKSIAKIKDAENYKEILIIIKTIGNVYEIQNNSVFRLAEQDDKNNEYDYNNTTSKPIDIIKNIFKRIEIRISNENITMIEQDKETIIKELIDLYQNTEFNKICIKSIDELCINNNKLKPVYNGYFLKIFELLFKETYCDYFEYSNIYPKFETVEEDKIIIPYIEMIEKYISRICYSSSLLTTITKHQSSLEIYFEKIYKDVNSELNKSSDDCLHVDFAPRFYEHLSAIVINLFITIAKNIVISQNMVNTLSKISRLQFIEIFNAIRDSTPTLLNFNESQLYCLHYCLLTKKVLTQSVQVITKFNKGEIEERRTRKRKTKTEDDEEEPKNNKKITKKKGKNNQSESDDDI